MISSKKIRIATRKSPLALWQANSIRDQLMVLWPDLEVELVPMSTSGDKFLSDKLLTIGGKGLFVKELEEALLAKRADIAVHSMKDVPIAFPDGLMLAVICARHNPLDAFVSELYTHFDSLPDGASVGTSSLRRQSQLLAKNASLVIQPLRGNIHTRLLKMEQGGYDAIILAAAGLERMGMHSKIRETFTPEVMLPACGQGALGVECREDDDAMQTLLAPLNDEITARCVMAERRVNALLGGNCHTPLAVYCRPIDASTIRLSGRVASEDGKMILAHQFDGVYEQAMQLADQAVQALLADGVESFLSHEH
jgi:hydroxymethylbilane synthase